MTEDENNGQYWGNNPGNFANDPERADEAGRKGGQASGGRDGSEESDKS
ncbi:general stress protein [Pseudomonas alliivorans]